MEDFVGSAQRLSADSESAGRRKRGWADQSLAPAHRCLLALLRLGIGCGTGTLPEIPWACWPDLYCLAWEHGVGALCFDGARCMPKGKGAPVSMMMRWYGETSGQHRQKMAFDAAVEALALLFRHRGIPYVVFKGPAVASLYPDPGRRAHGDIDFFVPSAYFAQAMAAVEAVPGVKVERDNVDKHCAFDFQTVRFEMHYRMETFGYGPHQKYFGNLVENAMRHELPCYHAGEDEIPMLPPMIDLMVLFKHWFNHLLGEGIGLRQTTDLAVAIRAYREKIQPGTLQCHLRAIGYIRAFDTVVALVERYFGVDWGAYWNASPEWTKEKAWDFAESLMHDVLRNGNFGRSSYRFPDGKLKRLETFSRFVAHCWRYRSLAPKDIIYMVPKRCLISFRAQLMHHN